MVGDEVNDSLLRTAIYGLAMESCQYATEICAQLKSLGIYYQKPLLDDLDGSNSMPDAELEAGQGNEVSYICSKNENFIVSAYKSILNENFLFPGLRDVMNYQLNALTCAFMKIKLLNSARFTLS